MKPFFSIIIPLYNKDKYIKNTLNSVFNQTFQDFEIIIINDGSSDNSLSEIESIKDSRINIYNQPNSGLSSARNSGITKAKANYIAFLDADDLWCKSYLECIHTMISIYKESNVFATDSLLWYKKKDPNLSFRNFNKGEFRLITNYFEIARNIFSYSSVVFHKSVFRRIGKFNENLTYGEEEDFSIRCFLKFNLVYSARAHVFYLQLIENQLTKPNKIKERVVPDFEIYLKDNTNQSLKKYIDFVYFKYVVLFKMEKKHKKVAFYKNKISIENLTFIQKIKYFLPTNLFYISKQIYISFSKRFIHF